jgi:hypothetical protein
MRPFFHGLKNTPHRGSGFRILIGGFQHYKIENIEWVWPEVALDFHRFARAHPRIGGYVTAAPQPCGGPTALSHPWR